MSNTLATAPIGASGSRRRSADEIDAVRAVGTRFLRTRPFVITPVAIANAALLALSGAPTGQRITAGAGFGAAVVLFWGERSLLRSRLVTTRWLATSLLSTALLLGVGCALTGGVASPMVVLLATPVVVGAAAFGRTRPTWILLAVATALGLLLASVSLPYARPPAPWSSVMSVFALGGMLALAVDGVAGLVDAHQRTSDRLDRMRLATLEETASRMRATEQVGAKVAHELKNPLAGIKALLKLVRGGDHPVKAAERLGVALGEVDRMDGIVREYLAFARPLAELELSDVDLRALADDVVTVLAARAELAGVALAIHAPPDAVLRVQADARRVREALANLADNALAASPRGTVVGIHLAQAGEHVRVRIDDDGPGLGPGAGAPYFTTKPGGTGLGLVIARAAVEQHGGTLTVALRPEGGTRAEVTLPIGAAGSAV